jgi:(4S)-4-hydroxy-5-phosphonooxypentane-2,3-dione isomerase
MLKLIALPTAAITVAVMSWLLLPGYDAVAQSGSLFVNVVELDIVPAELDKFIAAIKENGAAAVKEPGCREFNIIVSQKNPNHIMLFEVYDNVAALDAYRVTDHFKKYQATTKDMVAYREVRQFSTISMNVK